ncbi:MAG: fasciclin domain-containing protein [Anaerolineae bacterium]
MRKLILLTLSLLPFLMLSPAAAQNSKGTFLRVLNLADTVGGAAGVDIVIDDTRPILTLAVGEVSAYIPLTAGTHTVSSVSPGDDSYTLTTLDIAVGDGNNYTLVLAGNGRAFVIDETTAFRGALLQTSSTILILNAAAEPLNVFYGMTSTTLQPDSFVVTDMPAIPTVFSVFAGDQPVLQEQLSGVPNNYTLLAVVSVDGAYQVRRANYTSLTAADFMRGLGIGGADGLNLAYAAFENASLVDELSGVGPLLIFAPTNAAIDAVNEDQLDAWLESRVLLENVMGYHLIPTDMSLFDIAHGLQFGGVPTFTSLQGTTPTFTLADDGVTVLVDGAHVVGTPYRVSNGVIYPLDTLLQPAVLPEVTVLP